MGIGPEKNRLAGNTRRQNGFSTGSLGVEIMNLKLAITCSIFFLLTWANTTVATAYETADVFLGLRSQVLNLSAEQINFPESKELQVIAFLMETAYEDAAVSLVAIADGTASLYLSTGGGFLGAGEHEAGRREALNLIGEAQKHINQMQKVSSFPLPEPEHTKYYAVTNQGVFTVDALEVDFGYERHPLSSIFHQGHQLLSVIRFIDEQRNENQ